MTATIGVVVIVGCVFVSYRLAKAIRRLDDDTADDLPTHELVVAAAENIVRQAAYGRHPSTWPNGAR